MTDLSQFPITRRWPAADPSVIQLYSLPTPNGVKVSIMLEETALPYEPHLVSFDTNDQMTPEFLSLNPNNKIPAIIDPNGPGGQPLALFESGAILIYLAEKTGQFLPEANRYEVLQWLMLQMGGVGPMFGQLGFFHAFAGREIEDPRPKERYRAEVARLLGVLDGALDGRDWIAGEYSIADIAIAPWLRTLRDRYGARDIVGWDALSRVPAYLDRFLERPAVQRGVAIPGRTRQPGIPRRGPGTNKRGPRSGRQGSLPPCRMTGQIPGVGTRLPGKARPHLRPRQQDEIPGRAGQRGRSQHPRLARRKVRIVQPRLIPGGRYEGPQPVLRRAHPRHRIVALIGAKGTFKRQRLGQAGAFPDQHADRFGQFRLRIGPGPGPAGHLLLAGGDHRAKPGDPVQRDRLCRLDKGKVARAAAQRLKRGVERKGRGTSRERENLAGPDRSKILEHGNIPRYNEGTLPRQNEQVVNL